MKQDRFLIGILVFIGLLVIAALTLFIVRNHAPVYGVEDSPQGVVRNYAVALQKGDYERAYSYLANMDTKPTFDAFTSEFTNKQLDFGNAALEVGQETRQMDNGTWVTVTIHYAGSGLLDNGWSNQDKVVLIKQHGTWKITYFPYPYFDNGLWFQTTPGPVKP
jgi:hypothetical protein